MHFLLNHARLDPQWHQEFQLTGSCPCPRCFWVCPHFCTLPICGSRTNSLPKHNEKDMSYCHRKNESILLQCVTCTIEKLNLAYFQVFHFTVDYLRALAYHILKQLAGNTENIETYFLGNLWMEKSVSLALLVQNFHLLLCSNSPLILLSRTRATGHDFFLRYCNIQPWYMHPQHTAE